MSLDDEVSGLPFIDKLWAVVEKGELDFWQDRRNPPNLSVDEFRKVLDRPHGKDVEAYSSCAEFTLFSPPHFNK